VDAGDYVVVSDALSVRLTGKKHEQKIYKHHSGFIGGLKEVPISRMRERRPEEVRHLIWSQRGSEKEQKKLTTGCPKSRLWHVAQKHIPTKTS
jgi:ribosomal protein L13